MSHELYTKLCRCESRTLQHTATHCNTSTYADMSHELHQFMYIRVTTYNILYRYESRTIIIGTTDPALGPRGTAANAATTLQHSATLCNTLQHSATLCNTLQHPATHCNTLQYTTTHCNKLQHSATHCNPRIHRCDRLCNTLQHTATHCNTLQHTYSQM